MLDGSKLRLLAAFYGSKARRVQGKKRAQHMRDMAEMLAALADLDTEEPETKLGEILLGKLAEIQSGE